MSNQKPKRPLIDKIREASEDFRDPEIEYQLASYLIRVNPTSCGMIRGAWFSDILLQDIFLVANDLRLTLSKPMLMNELVTRGFIGDGESELYEEVVDQLFSFDTTAFNDKNARHMMRQVLRLYETRNILTGCGEVVSSIGQFNLEDAKRKLSLLSKRTDLVDPQNCGMYLDDYESRVETIKDGAERAALSEDGDVGIPTGVYRFDRLVGGLMRKEFGVIAGITGVGKTSALVSFAIHAWLKGYDVMMVSGEMSKEALEFRIDSHLTTIPGLKFRTADLDDADYQTWDSVIRMYRAQHDNILYVGSYTRKFTTDNIERDLLRVQEETGRKVSVICCDYLNIMYPVSKSGKGGWEDQAEAVWDFKGLVSEYDLVGWTAGQVKDEAYEKELYDAADLKYARAISECAPVIAALIRSDRDIIENRMKLQILKMRNAPVPPKPILLTPRLDIMHLHQDICVEKTLRGRVADTIDTERKPRTARPRKKALSDVL